MVPLVARDVFILCSDGLNTMVAEEDIRLILVDNDPDQVCRALIDAANSQGGLDNTTVVVARVGGRTEPTFRASVGTPVDQETQEVKSRPSVWQTVVGLMFRRRV